jgi:hypothetical protein
VTTPDLVGSFTTIRDIYIKDIMDSSSIYIPCAICGTKMKNHINGSHLKKHLLTIQEYLIQYPTAETGSYNTSNFKCAICNEVVNNNSSIKSKHINDHGYTIDEYNIKYTKIECGCGCGNIAEYSYSRHKYNKFVTGHDYKSWNSGLTMATNDSLKRISEARKKTKGTYTEDQKRQISEKTKLFWKMNPESKSRMVESYKDTMTEKYGVDNFSKTPEFLEKFKKTSLERYGVEYPNQHPDVYERSCKGRKYFKDYTLPSGKKIRIQGYEGYALDILLTTYHEDDILTKKSDMPKVWYQFENKTRRYYPDIYIPLENLIIEVKSIYTYNLETEQIHSKINALKELGFNTNIWIIDKKIIYSVIK